MLALPWSALEGCDIALMNLLCAEGLPGAETLVVQESLAKINGFARHVEAETRRHFYRFRKAPEEFENSEAFFRMLMLAVVLHEDLGMRYNPERISSPGVFEPNESFFADSRDVLIHGLLGATQMGTCSSMPVFYVAVGRRLGYPLKLVTAKNHLFVRWEDSRERLNIDGSGRGCSTFDDNHYRQWPLPMTAEEEQKFGYLKSLTSAQELAVFLSIRGHCLLAAGRYAEAIAAHAHALQVFPESVAQKLVLSRIQQEIALRTNPDVFIPPDPILQITGDEGDWAARRAEILSRQKRAERLGLPNPKVLLDSTLPPSPFQTLPNNRTEMVSQ